MKINYVKGDATQPIGDGNKVIVHVCNDIGAWGRGFVVAISKRWKEPEREYREWHKSGYGRSGEFKLGNVQFSIAEIDVDNSIVVANLIGQHTVWNDKHGNPPIRYDAIRDGLKKVYDFCIRHECSVHAPQFGAGLAGGDWNVIEQIINDELVDRGIPVTIYIWE